MFLLCVLVYCGLSHGDTALSTPNAFAESACTCATAVSDCNSLFSDSKIRSSQLTEVAGRALSHVHVESLRRRRLGNLNDAKWNSPLTCCERIELRKNVSNVKTKAKKQGLSLREQKFYHEAWFRSTDLRVMSPSL